MLPLVRFRGGLVGVHRGGVGRIDYTWSRDGKEEAGAGEIRDSRLGRKGCALGKGKEKGKDKIQSERNSLREATNNGDPLIKMDEKNTMKSRENKGNRCFES